MCGIVSVFNIVQTPEEIREQVLAMAKKIRHRGPDWSGIFQHSKAIMAHERLSIVDPSSGGQPLYSADGLVVLAINGEIYNHKQLQAEFPEYAFQTQSDCEVLLPLYQKYGDSFLDMLNGIFAFSLYDIKKDRYLIGRDHMGICPLYHGWDSMGQYYVASELKALEGICERMETFPPGHYLYAPDLAPQKWYKRPWISYENVENNAADHGVLRDALESAVHRQLMTDVPYGVLLSGGLDSSITSALAAKYARTRVESGDTQEAWYPRLHSFAVGLQGSPDLKAAQKMADHIGSVHHEIHFTVQQGLDAISDVIYQLETYDVTTVRAATPMYLLGRVIKSMGIKMVLSGEGSDELFGGYLYFHKAPSAKDFHEETVRKLEQLHLYDCLRANKALMAWGVEGRVPFLDKEFIDVAMSLNTQAKLIDSKNGKIEKYALRKAFEDLLPQEIAWRQKEQFSDGVGYLWIDSLKAEAEKQISDELFSRAGERFPINPPKSKEEYRYRVLFESHFPSDAAAKTVPSQASVACSSPAALEWDESFKILQDPSGRAVGVHAQNY